jgi:hypothetical protein
VIKDAVALTAPAYLHYQILPVTQPIIPYFQTSLVILQYTASKKNFMENHLLYKLKKTIMVEKSDCSITNLVDLEALLERVRKGELADSDLVFLPPTKNFIALMPNPIRINQAAFSQHYDCIVVAKQLPKVRMSSNFSFRH